VKIKKYINVDAEVDVDIALEDIVAQITAEPDCLPQVLTGFNNVAQFIKAVPDKMIADMTPLQRVLICGFLEEQGKRIAAIRKTT
jgi:ActR/RegA family two-component response regulator